MPLTPEVGELNLVVGAADPYGQALAGSRIIERAGQTPGAKGSFAGDFRAVFRRQS